jgi:hypothetical protein
MKAAIVFSAALAVFVSGGPTKLHGDGVAVETADTSPIAVPVWLGLGKAPYLTSVEYAGEPGAEWQRGTLTFVLPDNGISTVAAMSQRFAGRGFMVEDRTSSLDNFMGADSVASATDPVTGRTAVYSLTQTKDGALLRLQFTEPSYI